MIKTRINGKYELFLPEHRAKRPQWQTGWEVKRIDSMVDNLKEGDVVFDIGTEEGDISALLSQKIGRTGGIVMFEPEPKVWANIRAIWEANNLKKPLAIYVGFASDKTKENPNDLDINKEIKDGWTIYAYGEIISDHGFRHLMDWSNKIPQIKLDDFCERNNIYPDLITIDIEGAELKALMGAKRVLKECKPLVYVSIHPDLMKEMYKMQYQDLHIFMKKLEYQEIYIETDHEEHFMFKTV